jgi:xanthine dehydrogenase accessory factor
MDNLPELALDWHRAGRGAVLATVIETWGSAPRRAGSQMLVDAAGAMEGSVSGGCVEGAVVLEAVDALQAGQGRVLTYGVSDEDAFAVGLACGGTIRVLVQPVDAGVLQALVAARAAGRAVAVVTDMDGLRQQVLGAEDAAVAARLRSDQSGVDGDRFIAVHNPPLRLIVVGAVHIAQGLMTMARLCDYAPVLIDPRTAFGAQARFPGEVILSDWPDEAMATLRPDARTAVVTLTHDPKLDDPALAAALRSDAFYIGCLGSRRTHAKRLDRLTAAGFTPQDLSRLHAPVGLDIGARTPAEIAVSVMAEVIAVLRQGKSDL